MVHALIVVQNNMRIIRRILISLPIALGLGVFLTTCGLLLDAYEDSEKYRNMAGPILERVMNSDQQPQFTVDERFELRMELPRSQMDKGSFEHLRLRLLGGIFLMLIGSLVVSRFDARTATKESHARSNKNAQSGPRE